jgi:hypothetical protein
MSGTKLITLAILGALAWQHQALLRDKVDLVRQVPELTNTYVEMRSYRIQLMRHMNDNDGRPPGNVQDWLRRHFENPAKADPALDHFGTPYRLETRRSEGPALRSCGPDGRCGNADDLLVPLSG